MDDLGDLGRPLMLAIWGGVCIYGYGSTLINRLIDFRAHKHDRRSRRELLSALALFITAVCSAGSIAFLLFGPEGTGARGFMVALALGAFAAAGIVMKGERGTIAEGQSPGTGS